jgi:hypothetical protein
MIKWFTINKLALSLDYGNVIKFIPYYLPQYRLHIDYKEGYIGESVNTEFLGLQTDNHLSWKNHVDQTIPKLSRECYGIKTDV